MNFKRYNVTARYAELMIGTGWLALYRGRGFMSRWIQYSTFGPYSHAGMLCRVNGHVDVLEQREFYGPRRLPLVKHVRECPGLIDVYQIDRSLFPHYDAYGAVRKMREMTACDYNYRGVAVQWLRRIPFLRSLWSLDLADDVTAANVNAAFCSEAIACADQFGGGVDAFPNKLNAYVTPVDLSQSPLRRYAFTIVPDQEDL